MEKLLLKWKKMKENTAKLQTLAFFSLFDFFSWEEKSE